MSLVGFDPTFAEPPDFPTPQSPCADLNCTRRLTKPEHRRLCFMGEHRAELESASVSLEG